MAPPKADDLPTMAPVQAMTEAVSVNFIADAGADPKQILHDQGAQLAALDAGFTILEEGPHTCQFGAGWSVTQRVNFQGTLVCQIAFACRVDTASSCGDRRRAPICL
ncbi:MAG: hypothetical protein R3C68_13865 [Myxococcota bacterium]